jgi:hypothetical protein
MRRRILTLLSAGRFVFAATVYALAQGAAAGVWIAVESACLLEMPVSGAVAVMLGGQAVRDRILGRTRARVPLFPPGRCHACGYDTSSLVRGIVACPECGVILACSPRANRSGSELV